MDLSVLIIIIVVAVPFIRFRCQRDSCVSMLRVTWCSIHMYQMDNNGFYPSRITELGPAGRTCYGSIMKEFICPASGRQPGNPTNIDEWMDYIYIPWSTGANTLPDYPLMYDRRLSNHQGKGINLLFMDGSVIWDKDAKELKAFAAKHPEFQIPLPEDARR